MATYYADTSTGGTGATSDTWANAMSTVTEIISSSTLGATANLSLQPGDFIFCRHGTAGTGQVFDENGGAALTWSFGTSDIDNPIRVYCVNDSTTNEPPQDTDLLAAGIYGLCRAATGGGDLIVNGVAELHNFHFSAADNLSLAIAHNSYLILDDCRVDAEDAFAVNNTYDAVQSIWRNVWLKANNTGTVLNMPLEGTLEWSGGGFHSTHTASEQLIVSTVTKASLYFENLDFTAYTSAAGLFSNGVRLVARNCQVHANTVLGPDSPGEPAARMVWMGTQSDTSGVNAPSIQGHISTHYGECVSSTAYTLAASDGTTAYSYKMVPSGDRHLAGAEGLKSFEIHVPVTTSDTQIKINIMRKATAGAPALLDKENCFIRGNEPANDTTLYDVVSSNEGPFKATPTTWSTNTEAWSGSPANPTKQELTLAISPEHDETMQVWVVYTGDTETGEALDLYVDPKAVVT